MNLTSFIDLSLNVLTSFLSASIFFFNLDLNESISIIRHANLFFRSYSLNLSAMLYCFEMAAAE